MTTVAFSIGVDGAAVAPAGLANLGVPRPARHAHDAVLGAAARDPDVEAGRLGDDARVRAQPALDDRRAACAGRLLVRVRRDDQVAGEADTFRGEHLGGEHHRRDPALHVAGAAAVELPVSHLRGERLARPALARLDRDDVDVAVEDERAAAA